MALHAGDKSITGNEIEEDNREHLNRTIYKNTIQKHVPNFWKHPSTHNLIIFTIPRSTKRGF